MLGDEKIATFQTQVDDTSYTTDDDTFVYHIADHLNSSSLDLSTTGSLLQATDYQPFGKTITYEVTSKRIKGKKGGYTNKYLFANKQLDEESDLQYFEKRYYDPRIGRFTTEDPVFWEVGFTKRPSQYFTDPQQWNSYSYVRNNPINYTDPTGECMGDDSMGCIQRYKQDVKDAINSDSFLLNVTGYLAEQNFVPILDDGAKALDGDTKGIVNTGLNVTSVSPLGKIGGVFGKGLASVIRSEKIIAHLSTAKHGLDAISKDINVVISKIESSILSNRGVLKEGSNQILTKINNQITTIRVEIKNGATINVNAFIGDATRKIGNFIDNTKK